MTKQQACVQLAKYPHDPLLISDMSTQAFKDNCWCRDCVTAHEEAHVYTDWLEQFFQPLVDDFTDWCKYHEIDIVCSQPASTNCATALTTAIKAEYDYDWASRLIVAYENWYTGEGDALSVERDRYQEIIDALKAKCNS